jgi:hypothetical protein
MADIKRVNPATRETFEYRRDGWPLCPCCGEDELMSREFPARTTDMLQCLACSWRGTVPERPIGKRSID